MTNPIETGVGDDERRRIRLNELDAVDARVVASLEKTGTVIEQIEVRVVVVAVLSSLRRFIQSRRDRA